MQLSHLLTQSNLKGRKSGLLTYRGQLEVGVHIDPLQDPMLRKPALNSKLWHEFGCPPCLKDTTRREPWHASGIHTKSSQIRQIQGQTRFNRASFNFSSLVESNISHLNEMPSPTPDTAGFGETWNAMKPPHSRRRGQRTIGR